MPSIWVSGFQIRVIPGDHPPAHVHVVRGDSEAIFILDGLELRDNRGFKSQEVKAAQEAVASVIDELSQMWKDAQPI